MVRPSASFRKLLRIHHKLRWQLACFTYFPAAGSETKVWQLRRRVTAQPFDDFADDVVGG
jgi:hypothetical protein